MTNQLEKSRYVHDCSACEFIGQFLDWDMYVCPKDTGMGVELVARRSDEGSDYYSSGLAYADKMTPISPPMAALCYLRDLKTPCKGSDCARTIEVQTGYSKRGSYKTKWAFCVHERNRAVMFFNQLNTHSGYKKRMREYGFVTARVLW